jgi:hypothetical protein
MTTMTHDIPVRPATPLSIELASRMQAQPRRKVG